MINQSDAHHTWHERHDRGVGMITVLKRSAYGIEHDYQHVVDRANYRTHNYAQYGCSCS